jgi:hypothetical protein
MNHALALSRGDWIAPLDDDDEFTPDHVEVMLAECRARKLELLHARYMIEMRRGVWEEHGAPTLIQGQVAQPACFYSRRLLFLRYDVRAWMLDLPADWLLWQRMRDVGATIGYLDRVVALHYAENRPAWPEGAANECA